MTCLACLDAKHFRCRGCDCKLCATPVRASTGTAPAPTRRTAYVRAPYVPPGPVDAKKVLAIVQMLHRYQQTGRLE